MRTRKDDRGSAMIIIIVVIAFVSILVSTLYTMVALNIQMKSVDRKAKKSFYSAEGALEQINLGIQQEMSGIAQTAYADVMQSYSSVVLENLRRQNFNKKITDQLSQKLADGTNVTVYSLDTLKGYLTADVAANTVLSSTQACAMEKSSDESSLVLKGVVVTYTDAEGFQSVIETDIRVAAPKLNFSQASDMPNIFEYSLVANNKLISAGTSTLTITDNVYAGENGLVLTSGNNWSFTNGKRLVVKGDVSVPMGATVNVSEDTDLWAAEVKVSGGRLSALGRTFVADDLILEGNGSNVTLAGEYYGYGNGVDSSIVTNKVDSSAILVNGVQSSLDMTNLRRLLLSGSAQIKTGGGSASPEQTVQVENPASINDKLEETLITGGIYSIQSVSNSLLWQSSDTVRAQTQMANRGEQERLLIVNNSDGTISLRRSEGNANDIKYISVQGNANVDDYCLRANADTIGASEKFKLMKLNDSEGQYALKSMKNNKYVTVGDGGVLYATRDKVTENAQLFRLQFIDSYTVEAPAEDVAVTFTPHSYGDNLYVTIGLEDWLTHPGNASATLTYSCSNGGPSGTVEMTASAVSSNVRTADIGGLWQNIDVTYRIDYTTSTGSNYVEGTYRHQNGKGNSPEGTTAAPKLEDGLYTIYCPGAGNGQGRYWCQEGANGLETASHLNRTAASDAADSWEKVIILNNADGSISFWSLNANRFGRINLYNDKANKMYFNGETMNNTNTRFELEYSGTDCYYYIKIKDTDRYLYADAANDDAVTATTNGRPANLQRGQFDFRWVAYTTLAGEGIVKEGISTPSTGAAEGSTAATPSTYPVYSMSYYEEDKAAVSLKAADGAGYTIISANLVYSVDGVSKDEIAMTMNGGTGTAIVEELENNSKVEYSIYFYCSDGLTRNVIRNTYIHQQRYTTTTIGGTTNANVNLGESVELKSNQIAYLVPAECIGVQDGETVFGQNPMSAADYATMMAYEGTAGFEVVSFSKKVSALGGKRLNDYRSMGDPGYQTVFVQTPGGSSMVYFYVSFDSDHTSQYFRDYYAENQENMNNYVSKYANTVKTSQLFTQLVLDGNMIYSTTGDRIEIKEDGNNGATMNADERDSWRDEDDSYQKRFAALSTKLILDYDDILESEKTNDLFDNVIADDAFGLVPGSAATISATGTYFDTTYGSDTIRAVVVNNTTAPYVYNPTVKPEQAGLCLILSNGDVEIKEAFRGIIIAKGTIQVDSGVPTIGSNPDHLRSILQIRLDDSDPNSETFVAHFFKEGSSYVFDSADSVTSDTGFVNYSECITYENWMKR